ncbi:MAG: acyl-CoA desaturase [Chloroflexota bacterium]|nr:acyl-CoA desaturase [Chloroflexota bacterium]
MSDTSVIGTANSSLDRTSVKSTPPRTKVNEYAELKQLVKSKGLLEKQPRYYTYKILSTVGLLALSIAFLLLVNNFWLQLLNAAFLAIVFGQIGFLGHDGGHRQIFDATWKNDIVTLLQGNLLVGMSYSWWNNKHNAHHSHPNEVDMDPDIGIPAISFTEEQALGKRNFMRFLTKYQAFFFFPLLTLVGIDLQRVSIVHLFKMKVQHPVAEATFLVLHYVLYCALIFSRLNLWQGIIFIVVHQMLFGLYLGLTFAPNHKGMPILDKGSSIDFLRRQVLTARNVTSSPFNDFVYGGLNYQIEHHLFPSMPRKNLKEAQKTIRAYCASHSIAYYETTAPQSIKEILTYLHAVGAPLRGKTPPHKNVEYSVPRIKKVEAV